MLKIKSINSINIDGIPLISNNLYKRLSEYKEYINNNIKDDLVNKNELVILNIQGLYAYRVGILGWLTNYATSKISKYSNPTCLQRLLNTVINQNLIVCNDYEILCLFLSVISRSIPFINFKNWDPKENLFNNNLLKYAVNNTSKPSILNLNSIYLMQPFFDSGLATYSNKEPIEYGFERWKIWDRLNFKNKLFNRGIMWSYFQSEERKNGIAVINIDLENNITDAFIIEQLNQIVSLVESLRRKFTSSNSSLEIYETFVTGNFSIEFNLSNILQEINNKHNILRQVGLEILNQCENSSGNHFIMYSKYNVNEGYEFENDIKNKNIVNRTTLKILNDEILNIDFESCPIKDEVVIQIDETPIEIKKEDKEIQTTENFIFDKKEEQNNLSNSIKDEYFTDIKENKENKDNKENKKKNKNKNIKVDKENKENKEKDNNDDWLHV